MKIVIYLYVFTGVLLSSCEKFLDAEPTTSVTQDNYWRTQSDVSNFVTDIYATTFPVVYEGSIFFDEMMSDNAFLVWSGWYTNIRLLANGTQDASGTAPYNIWTRHYANIRKCYSVYENIDKVEGISAIDKETLLAEVEFLEAYNYHRLVFFFDKVPLITKTLTDQESKTVTQSDRETVLNHILDRLNLSIERLSDKTQPKGRADWGSALALKARVLLLENRFEELLPITQELSAKYSLNMAGDRPYEDLFSGMAENSNEIIFSIIRRASSGGVAEGHFANQIFFLKGMSGGDALRACTPTGSLVDAYPMADGRLIRENGSSYYPATPYLNRDPRLYQTVIYPTGNIKYWDGSSIQSTLYDPEDSSTQIKLQQYDAPEPSSSGYMWNKYVDWSPHAMVQITDCTNDIIIMRYADILLMRAEALVELNGSGSKSEVIDIIDQLRNRAKGGLVHRENYNTQGELLDLVRNERRIELANEGLRYFDLIRWRIAEKSPITEGYGLRGDLYGARMRKDGVGRSDRTVAVQGQERRWIEERFFNPAKHYLQPIPQKEIDLNPNLVQNPNW
ncbi:RagB/SusD family nutrient uptake outer membrane protein [Sphingobacterium deserti]|uniref:RagB/SusD domain-containing protein n=1 Tax=Sphingobacterium deserti TaxID=1229276 RepID=A0A0B8T9R2_9SPHI|nr:RagB/SusD family nutrient uptake outer membrane protein [Sphingobacterium deserti]KGE15504.1 hypothetical protein DI53_0608 [Sphingobacterium deserti]